MSRARATKRALLSAAEDPHRGLQHQVNAPERMNLTCRDRRHRRSDSVRDGTDKSTNADEGALRPAPGAERTDQLDGGDMTGTVRRTRWCGPGSVTSRGLSQRLPRPDSRENLDRRLFIRIRGQKARDRTGRNVCRSSRLLHERRRQRAGTLCVEWEGARCSPWLAPCARAASASPRRALRDYRPRS